MYPKRMKWVDIHLMRSDLNRVLDRLHDSLIIEVRQNDEGKDAHHDRELIEIKTRLDRIVDFLGPMETMKKGLFSSLNEVPTERLTPLPQEVVAGSISWLKSSESQVQPVREEIDRIVEDRAYIAEMKEKLTLLTGLDVDILAISSLSRTVVKVGTTRRFVELSSAVSKMGGELQGSLLDKKEGIHSVRILFTKGSSTNMEDVLRGRLFSEVNLDIPRFTRFVKRMIGSTKMLGYPVLRMIQELESIDDGLESSLISTREKGAALAGKLLPKTLAWREAVEIEIDKSNLGKSLAATSYTNRISGYIEADRSAELRSIMDSLTRGRYHIDQRDPTSEEVDDNRVPTKLANNRFVRLFEPLSLTFSTPRYNELDPTMWISIPFLLFFGLMLGDAGYGLLILLPSLYVFVKGKRSRTLRNIGALGILMGLSTTLAGIWMGAFFGDLIPRLFLGDPNRSLYSLSLFGYDLPYDTLKDPMVLFQISLWLGLAQLDLGFLLLGIDRLKKRQLWGFVKGTVSWALVQTGAVIFIGALLIGWWELNPVLTIIGASTFLSGSVLLFFEVGFMFLFNIEGLLGDWISYTRILALGLSTFGLAMAFNIVGEMLVDIHYVLIPIVAVLLLFLHVFNLLLQTLGSAVHSIRLQFVEFFGRFFEGGGESFEPFGREREHTGGMERSGYGGASR
ncbi:MAG: V-type ATP synthase subunit I [Thermoplasmatota archaeon]